MENMSRSSFSDWESMHEDSVPEERSNQEVVLELPAEGFDAASKEATKFGSNESVASSSISSFVPISRPFLRPPSNEIQSEASSYQYKSTTSDDSSLLSNFDILSLSSGEIIRRCKQCKFHNKNNSVICASCSLALVANPNVDMDAQIAVHLAQKEENDIMTKLMEAERKRSQICQDPLYDHACILTQDIREECGWFQTLSRDDLEVLALEFIKQVIEFPYCKRISFAFKCTHRNCVESVALEGFPADRPFGMTASEVEVSQSLEDALDSFEILGTMNGESLRPIPENASGVERPSLSCLYWVVATLQSPNSLDHIHANCPPGRVLPLAYFDSSKMGDMQNIVVTNFLLRLQNVFDNFFRESLQVQVSSPLQPNAKKVKRDESSDIASEHEASHDLSASESASAANESDNGLTKKIEAGIPASTVVGGRKSEPSAMGKVLGGEGPFFAQLCEPALPAGVTAAVSAPHASMPSGAEEPALASGDGGEATLKADEDDQFLKETNSLKVAGHITAHSVWKWCCCRLRRRASSLSERGRNLHKLVHVHLHGNRWG